MKIKYARQGTEKDNYSVCNANQCGWMKLKISFEEFIYETLSVKYGKHDELK